MRRTFFPFLLNRLKMEWPQSLGALRQIYDEYGNYGLNHSCKALGIPRGQAKRLLGIYKDAGAITEIANRECGLTNTRWR